MLRREAEAGGTQFALVTEQPAQRDTANEASIQTFRSIASAEGARWSAPRRLRVLPPAPQAGDAVGSPPAEPGLFNRRSPSGFRAPAFLRSFVRLSNPWFSTIGLAAVVVALMALLVISLAVLVPSATVTVVPASEPIQVTIELQAIRDAGVDRATGTLPARGLSVQVTGEGRLASTGRRQEPSGRARGTVVLQNRGARELAVPAGTIVATGTGDNVRFGTTAPGKVPANGSAAVPIEALLPGPTGLVKAGTINRVEGALATLLMAGNDAATAGGTTKEVAVVLEEDKDRLEAQLIEELKRRAMDRLSEKLEPGQFVPPESVAFTAMSPTFSPFVGDASPELHLSMTVQAVGMAVNTQAGNETALARLREAMPPGSRLVADSVRYIPGSVRMENQDTIGFSMTAIGTLLRPVDAAEVRQAVAGLTPARASAALSSRMTLAAPPRIKLGPDWLPLVEPTNVSGLKWRVRVVTDWNAAAAAAGYR